MIIDLLGWADLDHDTSPCFGVVALIRRAARTAPAQPAGQRDENGANGAALVAMAPALVAALALEGTNLAAPAAIEITGRSHLVDEDKGPDMVILLSERARHVHETAVKPPAHVSRRRARYVS